MPRAAKKPLAKTKTTKKIAVKSKAINKVKKV